MTNPRQDSTGKNRQVSAWRSLVNLVGYTVGAFTLLGFVSAFYTICEMWLYPILSHPRLLGPTTSAIVLAGITLVSQFFMALLVFRFFTRLRPFEVSLEDEAIQVKAHNSAEFWIPLAILLIYWNWIDLLIGILPNPALLFDLILLVFFWRHYAVQAPALLAGKAPVVLFLRPFASFSDRSLLASILNSLPAGSQAVFLIPRNESLRSRDPFSLGLAGMRLCETLQSVPIALITSDGEWQACVRYFIRRSQLIFMDISTLTPSLELEIQMLQELEAGKRTVMLVDEEAKGDSTRDAILNEKAHWLEMIEFQKRWQPMRSLAAFGMIVFALMGVFLDLLERHKQSSMVLLIVFILASIIALAYWFQVFAKKGAGSQVARKLKARSGSSTSPSGNWRWMVIGILLLIIGLLSGAAWGWNVIQGEAFEIQADVTIIGNEGLAVEQPQYMNNFSELEARAEWWTTTDDLMLDAQETSARRSVVMWHGNEGFRISDGITFSLAGRERAPASILDLPPTLMFTLHDLARENGGEVPPRLLYGLGPEEPMVISNSDYTWVVDAWYVGENSMMKAAGAVQQLMKMVIVLSIPVVLMAAGWSVMRN